MGIRPGRRRTGGNRHGLFRFTGPGGEVAADEVAANPRTVRCPFCSAPIGEECIQLGRGGRRSKLHGYHLSRRETADQAQRDWAATNTTGSEADPPSPTNTMEDL